MIKNTNKIRILESFPFPESSKIKKTLNVITIVKTKSLNILN